MKKVSVGGDNHFSPEKFENKFECPWVTKMVVYQKFLKNCRFVSCGKKSVDNRF